MELFSKNIRNRLQLIKFFVLLHDKISFVWIQMN